MSIPTNGSVAYKRAPGEDEKLWIIGGVYSYKATPQETAAYLACEVRARGGFAIPVHYHDDEEEGFYVAQGEVTVFLDEQEHRLSAGSFALAPRGTRHAFRFESDDAVLLLLLSPGPKHTEMFRQMGDPAPVLEPPPADVGRRPEELGPIAERYGTHIVASPPLR